MSDKTLEFFFDFGSPTTYLAHTQLPRLARESGARLVYRPMLLGGQQANEETFKEAAAQADADVTWRGREGMTPEYSRHLAEVTIYDALERAAAFARGRNE